MIIFSQAGSTQKDSGQFHKMNNHIMTKKLHTISSSLQVLQHAMKTKFTLIASSRNLLTKPEIKFTNLLAMEKMVCTKVQN